MMKSDQKSGIGTQIVRVGRQLNALSASVDKRFESVDKRFEAIDKRFDAVDKRFDAVDKRFDLVDERFGETAEALVEQRRYTEFAFEQLTGEMRRGFERLERKLDRFVRQATEDE